MEYREEDFSKAISIWLEWNEKINVISRKDTQAIFAHHILHSLAIARYMDIFYPGVRNTGLSFLDIGTGGGFPGIPLAMVSPRDSFTLCDSIGKKIKVASEVVSGLELENVNCLNCRAESLEGPYDFVVSRAVTSLENFYPWAKGKFNRSILYLKGGEIDLEIESLVRRFKLDSRNIRSWKISEWQKDDYFKEKFVIEIGKNYLCTP